MFGRVRHLVTPSRYNFSLNVGYLASARTLGAARSKSDKVVKKHTDEKLEPARLEACGPEMDDEEDEMEEMFVEGPAGMEWGGPTRGGRRPEPTRFGDWERKGRVSDF